MAVSEELSPKEAWIRPNSTLFHLQLSNKACLSAWESKATFIVRTPLMMPPYECE